MLRLNWIRVSALLLTNSSLVAADGTKAPDPAAAASPKAESGISPEMVIQACEQTDTKGKRQLRCPEEDAHDKHYCPKGWKLIRVKKKELTVECGSYFL